MNISVKKGVTQLVFGMKQKDVEDLYNLPDRQYKDDDGNIIYLYNAKKMRLTFYADEDYRLGYIIASHPELEIFSEKIIGRKWELVSSIAKNKGIKDFEKETFDSVDSYFNESNWIIFQVEFGEVLRVELGAIINNKTDEFEWQFK
ncbi:hypothetical protein [Flavobacterium sp. MK4S-17]|uniref:hypothetical protein n=1 Tax=Flavobacterium sp. MK4S-17 TaxID=2543737 RepID=UPI00135BD1F7|nr:hypothetical protein [Flavobacterium sp. MK4S-17]